MQGGGGETVRQAAWPLGRAHGPRAHVQGRGAAVGGTDEQGCVAARHERAWQPNAGHTSVGTGLVACWAMGRQTRAGSSPFVGAMHYAAGMQRHVQPGLGRRGGWRCGPAAGAGTCRGAALQGMREAMRC
jgi:hypothetical protein